MGGPDGGNGGDGGDVVLVVDEGVHTLLDFHHHPHQRAGNGKLGAGSHRAGARGADVELRIPDGTVVLEPDGAVRADLVGHGTRYVVAAGDRGGLGNAALANRRRRAPGFALLGEEGERGDVVLELKSVADVGLVGFPSAGKSSLIAAMSAARPKIADYPFTTLVPNLGVVAAGEETFTVADVPGLVPGAAEGRGLGIRFLRHIERCAVLVHVLDTATLEPGRDPLSDLDALEAELAGYQPSASLSGDGSVDLAERPRIVVLNKVDVPEGRELGELVRTDLEARGLAVYAVSAATHEGLTELGYALAAMVSAERERRPAIAPTRIVLHPRAVADRDYDVVRDPDDPDGFLVTGAKPERWVRQTDFGNEEAIGYLADRLARLGVEGTLHSFGAEAGDAVRIGAVTFDWEPTIDAGAVEFVPTVRGVDDRLDVSNRRRAAERLAAKRSRHRGAASSDDAAFDDVAVGRASSDDVPDAEFAAADDGR